MTLTIELPDSLAHQLRGRGISQERLEQVIADFVQELLREWDEAPAGNAASHLPLSDGATFARRVIANNRDLFDELARR